MRQVTLTISWTFLLCGLACSLACSQGIFMSRGVSLGTSTPFAGDVLGLFANPVAPAGSSIWEGSIVSSLPSRGTGFQFMGIAARRRLWDDLTIALEYSPGAELDFVFPSSVKIKGLDFATGRTVAYKEIFAGTVAFSISPSVTAGLTLRTRSASVTDPQLQLQDTTIVTVTNEARRTAWLADIGVRWNVSEVLAIALTGRSIPVVKGSALPEEFSAYELPRQSGIDAGVTWALSPSVGVALQGGTLKLGSVGGEWRFLPTASFRGAAFVDGDQTPAVVGGALGIGWTFGPITMEASYLKFADQTNRGTSIVASEVSGAPIKSVSLCPYTPDQLRLGMNVALNAGRTPQVRILGIDLHTPVFPSACRQYAYRPVGTVRIMNVSQVPVQVHASLFLDKLMDGPTESGSVSLAPEKEAEIPLMAVFNQELQGSRGVTVHDGIVTVRSTQDDDQDDRAQARVVVRGRNDWDGTVETLRYFVKPEDGDVLRVTREILASAADSFASVPSGLQLFAKVKTLCNAFAGKMVYVNDPRESADFVQYPDETLRLRGGDCDDMAVCFASLLGSIGVGTAFVDVVPPADSANSHIYLLVDTGIAPEYASNIAENQKRYVVRKGVGGMETVWIPLETTVITKGFVEAWTSGAKEFYGDTVVKPGIVDGWVKVMDLQ